MLDVEGRTLLLYPTQIDVRNALQEYGEFFKNDPSVSIKKHLGRIQFYSGEEILIGSATQGINWLRGMHLHLVYVFRANEIQDYDQIKMELQARVLMNGGKVVEL